MSRLGPLFQRLREQGERALITYITAGDPDRETSWALAKALLRAGADVLELGIPFSDPLMDGPILQASQFRALEAGTRTPQVLDMARRLRGETEAGLVLMTCYNLVHRYGLERFAQEAREAGVDGVLVTDLPPEEAGEWEQKAWAEGLDTIYLVAPTTDDRRLRTIAAHARGFIYCLSRRGVTGVRETLPSDLPETVRRIRLVSTLPIAVGFGISRPEHVRQVVRLAEGAVVGSAIVRLLAEGHPLEEIEAFARQLKEATKMP